MADQVLLADQYSVSQWPLSVRARRPYAFRPIAIDGGVGQPSGPPREYFYRGAIGNQLLRLDPPEPEGFLKFVSAFGLFELAKWAGDLGLLEWESLEMRLRAGETTFSRRSLLTPWRTEATASKFSLSRALLEDAYRDAHAISEWQTAMNAVIERGWEAGAFKIELELHPVTAQIVERPTHIFSRAWFDLIDALEKRHTAPRPCLYCHELHIPRRSDQKFCSLECQQAAASQRRSLDPRRRAYKTKWAQFKRGAITRSEFEAWRSQQQRSVEKEQ